MFRSQRVVTVAVCIVAAVTTVAGARYLVATSGRSADASRDARPAGAATLVRVVDGDTLVVDLDGREENVRLIGIDTPESVAHDRPVECYGKEASQRMIELLPEGIPIRLERDIEARDRYDRLLAYVYRADDGLFVNRAQVEDGYAEASPFEPNTTHQAEMASAERDARQRGAGLWRVCGTADLAIGPPATSG